MKRLIKSLYSGEISKGEFIKEYFYNNIPNEKDFLQFLKNEIGDKNPDAMEEVVVVLNTGVFNINSFVTELCELLQADWHFKHEDIAVLLKDLRSPSTIDCIYKAVELQFDYLDYDDTYQFARKCMKALSAIGGDNVIDKLKLLTKSEIPEIANYAQKELSRL